MRRDVLASGLLVAPRRPGRMRAGVLRAGVLRAGVLLVGGLLVAGGLALSASSGWADGVPAWLQRGADPTKVVGARSCRECHHPHAYEAWAHSPHATELFGKDREKVGAFASALGVRFPQREGACMTCHATVMEERGRKVPVSGVSCESCHGGAADWVSIHGDRRIPRAERFAKAEAAGMLHGGRLYEMAQRCVACHQVSVADLLDANHPAGERFELMRYSQGAVRHNFSGGADGAEARGNREASAARKYQLFLVGRLVELESGLRLLAGIEEEGATFESLRDRTDSAYQAVVGAAEVGGDERITAHLTAATEAVTAALEAIGEETGMEEMAEWFEPVSDYADALAGAADAAGAAARAVAAREAGTIAAPEGDERFDLALEQLKGWLAPGAKRTHPWTPAGK